MSLNRAKILFLITKGNWGGAQKYVYDLATSLPQEQFEVAVAAGEGQLLDAKLTTAGIRFISLPRAQRDISIFKDLFLFFWLIKLLRAEKPDIIHLNSSKMAGIGAVVGRLIGIKKIIFTVHGWAFNENKNFVARALMYFFSWLTAVLCTKIITVSEHDLNQGKKMLLTRNRVVLVQNGQANIDFLEPQSARQALAKNLPNLQKQMGAVWIGSTSELHKNKGLDVAIQAMAEATKTYPQIVYVIVGDGEEKKKLQSLVYKLGLETQVFLLGFVPDSKTYVLAFDIFLLPSRKEGLPYALLEAGLAGLPVISTKVGGIPEIIPSYGYGLLVTPDRPQELAEAIRWMMEHPEERKTMGENLKTRISEDFSQEKMLAKTISIYRS